MSDKRKPIHPKVAAGSIGGLVSTVLLWGLHQLGVDPPPDVAGAMAALLVTGCAYAARHLDAEGEPHRAQRAQVLNGLKARAGRMDEVATAQ